MTSNIKKTSPAIPETLAVDEATRAILAQAYARALRQTSESAGNAYQLDGNLWGLVHEGDPGLLGAQLIQLGDASIPYLLELLDDTGSVLFEGSEEATLGDMYQYRIKDFAAYYLHRITGIPLQFQRSQAQRDQAIQALQHKILESR